MDALPCVVIECIRLAIEEDKRTLWPDIRVTLHAFSSFAQKRQHLSLTKDITCKPTLALAKRASSVAAVALAELSKVSRN